MAHTFQIVTTIKMNSSQVMSFSRNIVVEATDSIVFDLAAEANNQQVEVQPTQATGRVNILAITADRYDALVSYSTTSADGGTPTMIVLDQPQVLIGQGAIGLLDPNAHPTRLYFTNGLSEPVGIQILVGRDAAL